MSKHNPNQDFYKIAGRSQTDGPDRLDANVDKEKQQLAEAQVENDRSSQNRDHPAIARSKKK